MVMIGSVKVGRNTATEAQNGSGRLLQFHEGGLDPVDALLSAKQGDHAEQVHASALSAQDHPEKLQHLAGLESLRGSHRLKTLLRGFCVERLQGSEGLAQREEERGAFGFPAFGDHSFVVLHGRFEEVTTGRQQLRFELHPVLQQGDGLQEVVVGPAGIVRVERIGFVHAEPQALSDPGIVLFAEVLFVEPLRLFRIELGTGLADAFE